MIMGQNHKLMADRRSYSTEVSDCLSLSLSLSLSHTLCCTLMTSLLWMSIRNIRGLIDLILGILSLFEVRNRKFCVG
jgi:hypothetical protein